MVVSVRLWRNLLGRFFFLRLGRPLPIRVMYLDEENSHQMRTLRNKITQIGYTHLEFVHPQGPGESRLGSRTLAKLEAFLFCFVLFRTPPGLGLQNLDEVLQAVLG